MLKENSSFLEVLINSFLCYNLSEKFCKKIKSYICWVSTNVFFEVTLLPSFVITMITGVADSFMLICYMLLEPTFLCSLVLTMITVVTDSFMAGFYMLFKLPFCLALFTITVYHTDHSSTRHLHGRLLRVV